MRPTLLGGPLVKFSKVGTNQYYTGAPSKTKSSRNSLNIDLDTGGGRSGLGRPLCGGAAKSLFNLHKSSFVKKGAITLGDSCNI